MLRTFIVFILLLPAIFVGKASAESLAVNEIMPLNIDTHIDPSWNYGGFVELYNPGETPVDLGNCYVSDDPDRLKMHPLPSDIGSVPAKGFYTLWFDHYDSKYSRKQVNLQLDRDGGVICLSNSLGELIVKEQYPAVPERVSYARTTDGGNTWGLMSEGTPNATNASGVFATEQLAKPQVDKDTQMFSSSLDIQVTVPDGCTLRYTTDGSVPTMTRGVTSESGSLTIYSTKVLRFRLFKEGMLPSGIVTRTYILNNKSYTLPILSVATNSNNLYGQSYGILVQGSGNGRTGNGQSVKCNWNMDWDRPVNVEYLTEEGEMVINQEVNMEPCGGWSRAWDPKSFKLKANKIYEGQNYYPYPLFDNKPFIKNRTLQIRNGGNDNHCRIKDPALQTIIASSGLNIDYQSYKPVMHFINGVCKGVINMREPNNKHFVEANYGYDDDEIDMFEMSPDSGYCQMTGTRDAFLQWYKLSSTASTKTSYEKIGQIVDLDEFINYMAIEFYLGGSDWPQNNVKAYYPFDDNGRFRFVLYDLDAAFSTRDPFNLFAGKKNHTFDYIFDTGKRITKEIELVTIWLNMLKNETFRKQFIDTYCMIAGSVFSPARCKEIVTELAGRVEAPMALNNESPWATANTLISTLSSEYQKSMVNALKQYQPMGLSSKSSISATISSDVEPGHILLNGMPIPTGKFSGVLFAPIKLTAQVPAGYRFIGWKEQLSGQKQTLLSAGGSWRYYDQGSLDGKDWKTSSYNTGTWKTGSAPLGYYTSDASNQRGYKTTLNYGSDANNKRPTYYFRQTVYVEAEPTASDVFTLDYTCDDGFVIYVNGKEAGRYLMPSGTISYSTYASTHAQGNPDKGSMELSPSLFKKGYNLIAVELHNNSGNSTDVYWDAALTETVNKSEDMQLVSTELTYDLPSNGTVKIQACYEPVGEVAGQAPVRINEVSADNASFVNDYWKKNDWIELYNPTSKDVDVAGMYLSDNLEKPKKYKIAAPSGKFFHQVQQPTVVPAHGFLVVWCDKLDPLWQLHTSFKLAADGGYLLLTADDGSWSDTLHYSAHDSKMTVGLYPDGGKTTYAMYRPTIGAPNTLTTVDTVHVQERPYKPTAIETTDTECMEIVYSEYFNLQGIKVLHPICGGIYIRRDLLKDGTTRSVKIIY